MSAMIPFSVLDLAPIVEGGDIVQALANSRDLVQHAERLGYHRFWLAEHHNMPGIASAATAVMIAHVGQGTRTIRLGAGGIMLPNHAPLLIAEQFGTLDAIYRAQFTPSAQLAQPYVMLGYNMFAAATDEEALLLSSSMKQTFLNLRRGAPTQLAPPNPDFEREIGSEERPMLAQVLSCSAIGSPNTVRAQMKAFIAATGADELMLASHIFDHGARMRSFEIAAAVRA